MKDEPQFSAEVLAAWRRCRGRGNEVAAAHLNRLLGLRPWQVSPVDARPGRSPWPANTAGATSWPRAQRLRRELDEAVRRRRAKRAEGVPNAQNGQTEHSREGT
jgi:hypothetical protein